MLDIKQGEPLPPDRRGRTLKYPFKSMQVGDSFLAEYEDTSLSGRRRLQVSVLGACRRNRVKDAKFVTRQEDNGVFCKRVE